MQVPAERGAARTHSESESLDVGTNAYDEADDLYDPTEFAEKNDKLLQ